MKAKVTIQIVDENGKVSTTYNDVRDLSTTNGTDLEYEVVLSSVGSPIPRPKNPPKY